MFRYALTAGPTTSRDTAAVVSVVEVTWSEAASPLNCRRVCSGTVAEVSCLVRSATSGDAGGGSGELAIHCLTRRAG